MSRIQPRLQNPLPPPLTLPSGSVAELALFYINLWQKTLFYCNVLLEYGSEAQKPVNKVASKHTVRGSSHMARSVIICRREVWVLVPLDSFPEKRLAIPELWVDFSHS